MHQNWSKNYLGETIGDKGYGSIEIVLSEILISLTGCLDS